MRSNGFVSIHALAVSTIVHSSPCVSMDRIMDMPSLPHQLGLQRLYSH